MGTTKYFLQTTSVKANTNLEILYLGDWAGKGETVPFQWNNPKKVDEAYLFCEKIYKKTLPKIRRELNIFHEIELSEKQYHIILGNWLKPFTNQLYDKYTHLKYALENYDILETYISNLNFVPTEYSEYLTLLREDSYNLHLYSQILKKMTDDVKFTEIEIDLKQKSKFQVFENQKKKFLFKFLNLFSKRLNFTITTPYFRYKSFQNYLSLAKTGKLRFDDFEYKLEVEAEPNWENRKSLEFGKGEDEFENILFSLLPKNIPTLFLEGFLEFWKKVEDLEIPKTELFYNANSLYGNYVYKFFIAQNSPKVVTHQHGGNYGFLKNMPNEEYEKSISDIFYTWGWKDEESIYIPTPRLLFPKKKRGKKILLALDFSPRYIHRFQTQHFSTTFQKFETSLWQVLKSRKDIVLRNYYTHNGRDTIERIRIEFPEVEIESPKEVSFDKSLQNTKLFISLHSSTTFLETLAQNIPTLVLLDPEIYSFRDEFKPYLKLLLDSKIAFEKVEELIKGIENFSENWWSSDEVQEARKKFVFQYARTSSDWVKEWIEVFEDIS